jgi:hypothetical protein
MVYSGGIDHPQEPFPLVETGTCIGVVDRFVLALSCLQNVLNACWRWDGTVLVLDMILPEALAGGGVVSPVPKGDVSSPPLLRKVL